jgi:hypothetical protein
MITGECPYCDAVVMTPIADQCPAFSKETCPECKKEYWLKHSRVDPKAYMLESVDVDEETRSIKAVRE